MNKYSKILLSIVSLLIFTNNVFAATIKETVTKNDNYDTIEPNTTIIGVTKFTQNEVITASKATKAGANDATLYMKKHGTTDGYTSPTIYVYYGQAGGWYSLDENNKPKYIDDQKLTNKLSNLDIYYVNNKEKVIGVEYTGDEIDTTKLPSGVSYSNNQLQINSTLSFFDIYTKKNDKISYSFNDTLNTFEIDNTSCYSVNNGYITDYDETCEKNVVIPSKIKNEKIIGIGWGAFNNTGITSVIIPETIIHIEGIAFENNNLTSVIIKEKFDLSTSSHMPGYFRSLGENIFGDFTNITFDNYLTRALDLIPNKLEINISKDFSCKNYSDHFDLCKYTVDKYATTKLEDLLAKNGYNIVNIGNYNYDEYNPEIHISVDLLENETDYKVTLTTNDASYNTVSKTIEIEIKEFESTKEEQNEINNILKDIDETNDPYFEGYLNTNLFNNLQEKYEFDIKQYSAITLGQGSGNPYDIFSEVDSSMQIYYSYGETIFIEKDNKLHGATHYKETIRAYYIDNNYSIGNYSSPKEYVDKYLLKEITEKYKIENYDMTIKEDAWDDSEYNEFEDNEIDDKKVYYLCIIDKDTNNKWLVVFNKYSDAIHTKEVPIKIIPEGILKEGKAINSITPSASKITLYGTEEALNKIEYLPVKLYVSELDSDKKMNIVLETPEEIENLSLNHINVNVTLGEETTKEIENLMIEVLNLDANYKAAAIEPNSVKVNVIIKGTQEVLDTIDENKIRAVIDLSEYTEVGDYEVEIKIIGEELKATYTPVTEKITVRISEK